MWRAVQRTLIEHPGIALVEVNSPGGQVSPAIAIADLIRKRGLDTLAEGRCYSACTLIFLAGQNAYWVLSPGWASMLLIAAWLTPKTALARDQSCHHTTICESRR